MQKKIKPAGQLRERAVPYLFLLPFILSFLIFFVYPAVYSLVLSLHKYKGYGDMTFVGFQNYQRLFTYQTMWNTLLNTLQYYVFSFVPVMIVSFMLAVIVRSKSVKRFQALYKPMIFMPQVCAVVASALIFKVIFGNQIGVVNQILGTQIPFLSDTKLMKIPVVAMMIWRQTGWYFILFLSGLTTINEEINEASKIDGANAFQHLIYVTIPMMKPIFKVVFVTYTIGALKLYTEPNLIISNEEAPLTVAPYVNMITSNISGGVFGMASAAGWVLVIFIIIITFFLMRALKEES